MKSMIFTLIIVSSAAVQALPVARVKGLPSLVRKSSFEETYQRYPSPYAIIQQLRHIVPHGGASSSCLELGERAAPVIGTHDPMQGSALEETPGALFYPFFESCVREMVDSGFRGDNEGMVNANEILGQELMAELTMLFSTNCSSTQSSRLRACDYSNSGRYVKFFALTQWDQLTTEWQEKLMLAFIRYLTGPDTVLRGLNLIGPNSDFGPQVTDTPSLVKFLNQAALQIRDGGQSLTVAQVYAEIAIVLRLGPALKN